MSLPIKENPFLRCTLAPMSVSFPVARPYLRQQTTHYPLIRLVGLGLILAILLLYPAHTPNGQAFRIQQQLSQALSSLPGWPFSTKPQSAQASANLTPVRYHYISSHFGRRNGRPHQGIDFAAPHGAPIQAMAEGHVQFAGWQPGYGQTIIVDHGQGIKSRYAHCSRLMVRPEQQVTRGTIIARVGSTGHSTGPHLHFEVIERGIPKNPAAYLALNHKD